MFGQNLFDYYTQEKVKKLVVIRERNIMVRNIREMVKRANDQDYKLARRYDEIQNKMLIHDKKK